MKKLTEIKKGYKERKKYIIELNNEKYFVKVIPYLLSSVDIEKTKWIYKIYQEEGIPLVPLLDIIYKENNTLLIFPYFKGKDLEECSLTLKQYENYGKKVALEVKKMNRITSYPSSFKRFDLMGHYYEYIDLLEKLIISYESKIANFFSREEINKLISRFQALSLDILHDEVMLNHNDIKIANIMLDNDGDYYLIDIEPIDLTYKGFNINYSIYTFLFDNGFEEKEKSFLKGFIKEYDPNKSLIKEWEYFIIADFINELANILENYYDYLKNNISFVKKVLFNENNILKEILYQ